MKQLLERDYFFKTNNDRGNIMEGITLTENESINPMPIITDTVIPAGDIPAAILPTIRTSFVSVFGFSASL